MRAFGIWHIKFVLWKEEGIDDCGRKSWLQNHVAILISQSSIRLNHSSLASAKLDDLIPIIKTPYPCHIWSWALASLCLLRNKFGYIGIWTRLVIIFLELLLSSWFDSCQMYLDWPMEFVWSWVALTSQWTWTKKWNMPVFWSIVYHYSTWQRHQRGLVAMSTMHKGCHILFGLTFVWNDIHFVLDNCHGSDVI